MNRIYGVGVDICKNSRMEKILLSRTKSNFLNKALNLLEIRELETK